MKKCTITEARMICEQHEARQIVVLLFDGEKFAGVSYGATRGECARVAMTLDDIVDALRSGELRAP